MPDFTKLSQIVNFTGILNETRIFKLYSMKREKDFSFPSFLPEISWKLELLAYLPFPVPTTSMGLYVPD